MHVRFTIPNDEKLVYVGSLVITFADKNALSSRSFVLHIEDQHENALDALQRKFPETKGDMAKHLMSLVKMR